MHSYVRAALVPKALKQFVIKRSNNLLCPKANSMALLAYKDATALGILFETGMKKGEAISTLWPLLFYGLIEANAHMLWFFNSKPRNQRAVRWAMQSGEWHNR